VLHPVEDGGAIDRHAAFGQEHHDVGIRQAQTKVATHGHGDEVVRSVKR